MKRVIVLIVSAMLVLSAAMANAATITITVPDPLVSDVLDAFATTYGRPVTIENPDWQDDGAAEDPDGEGDDRFIANPETKAAFAKRIVAQFAKQVYIAYKKTQAAEAAAVAAEAQAEIDSDGVE